MQAKKFKCHEQMHLNVRITIIVVGGNVIMLVFELYIIATLRFNSNKKIAHCKCRFRNFVNNLTTVFIPCFYCPKCT